MKNSTKNKINVGGQAVIEGVMMRSPHAVAIAVRKPSGEIVVKKDAFTSWTKRWKLFGLPIIRGAFVLIESIVLGIKALSFSGDMAMDEDDNGTGDSQSKPKTISGIRLALLVLFSFAIGMLLFFYLPLILADLLGIESGFWFNIADGIFRMLIFLSYLFAITLLKDIRRIFQYHGAEHKSIFAYENGLELTIPNTEPFTTHHPRCGTSFLLIVMIVSVLVFVFLGRPDTIGDRLIRLLFVPLIGGLSYELIRLSGKFSNRSWASWFIAPGLWLQRITTKEPDHSQLEVAIAALQAALSFDFTQSYQTIKVDQQT